MSHRTTTVLLATLIGAMPGLTLILLAQFVIAGEVELTVGAPGFVLAPVGALLGLVIGLRRGSTTSA
jgi:hypothetical protein